MATYKQIEISQAFGVFDDILDVRSPAEYADDHLPGAISVPVLNDEERARIGTLYTQVSPFEAKKQGAALIARNIAQHLEERFHDRPKTWRPLVYCWRGGMRSGAMAHILAQVGWNVAQLEGGYKNYRRHVIAALETLPAKFDFCVISGGTGSGKSHLLHALEEQGAQVLDLEKLAQHRGSLLGKLPDQPQPSQKTFETRLWDANRNITESMRSKEEAHDYRYFPDPDLVPMTVERAWIDEIRASLPELPDAKCRRFVSDLGLPEYDADLLTSERETAEWFEEVVNAGGQPKAVSNWMMGELMKLLNEENRSIADCPIKPSQLADMLKLIENGTISGKIAKTVFDEIYKTGKDAAEIVKEKGLVQISDSSEIENVLDAIIAKSPKEVERFKAGDEKLIGFFVGQAMKATKGKANPQILNELLQKKLS